jgi:hypothetical protein
MGRGSSGRVTVGVLGVTTSGVRVFKKNFKIFHKNESKSLATSAVKNVLTASSVQQ